MSQSLSEPLALQLPNHTRRSESIPRRLAAEGKFHLLPVYALLTTSDLAREGIRNSGSFRFADHIYRNEPSGRYGVGRVLDRVLLKLRGARSMRSRFFHSRREILRAVNEMRGASSAVRDGATVDVFPIAASRLPLPDCGFPLPASRSPLQLDQLVVVSVPCGIARDLFDVAETLWTAPALYEQVRFIGIDLDQEALDLSWNLTQDHFDFEFRRADALAAESLPKNLDVIVSLGFGEFLSDDVLRDFYRRCHASLNDGGRFITSAMNRDRLSDYLARELAELHTNYRSTEQLTGLLRSAGFANIRTTRDEVGLQTLAVAEKAL